MLPTAPRTRTRAAGACIVGALYVFRIVCTGRKGVYKIKCRAAFQSQVSQSFNNYFLFYFEEWLLKLGAGSVSLDKQMAALLFQTKF